MALDSTGEAQTRLHVHTEPRAGAGLEDLWERGQWSWGLKPGGLGRVGSAQQTVDGGQLAPGHGYQGLWPCLDQQDQAVVS